MPAFSIGALKFPVVTRASLAGVALTLNAATWSPACDVSPFTPAPVGEGIVIYVHSAYRGPLERVNENFEDLEYVDGPCRKPEDSANAKTHWGDCISSIRLNSGWTAVLYEHSSFKGQSLTITTDILDLAGMPGPCKGTFNDCVSSIRVSRVR